MASTNEYGSQVELRKFDLAATDDIKKLADWSTNYAEMIELNTEGIARHHLSVGAYVWGGIAGYAAITVMYSSKVVEFGGLVVDPDMRRLNIGSTLTKNVIQQAREELDPELIVAFSGDKSAPLFKKLGGQVVENANNLPSEVWKLCYICPKHEAAQASGSNCCERVYDMTNIDTGQH